MQSLKIAVVLLSLAYVASAQQYNQYSYYEQTAPKTVPQVVPQAVPQTAPQSGFIPMTGSPAKTAEPAHLILATTGTPCTAEVLRMSEVQAFKDPTDIRFYVVCTDIDVYERMPCAPGTFFEDTLRFCVPDGWVKPDCPADFCLNGADCIIDHSKNEYKCICKIGYDGVRCEQNIDECALEGNKACAGGRCVDQLNGYYCDFGTLIGVNSVDTIQKPCTLKDLALGLQFFEVPSHLGNVFLQCTGENTFVVSRCADLLYWNQEFLTCTLDRPVAKTGVCKSFPCHNEGVCHDLGNNNFHCECPGGFTGALCEQIIDHCDSNPCVNNGRCVSHLNGYNCVCQNKVVDDSCRLFVENQCTVALETLPFPFTNTKYFLCGVGGFAFVKQCADGLFWDVVQKTCIAPKMIREKVDFTNLNKEVSKSATIVKTEKPKPVAPVTPVVIASTVSTAPLVTVTAKPETRPQMALPTPAAPVVPVYTVLPVTSAALVRQPVGYPSYSQNYQSPVQSSTVQRMLRMRG